MSGAPVRTTFTLQLTERCNLACTYCYVRACATRSDEDCSSELCEAFVDFALREGGDEVRIAFFGGEPLLRPDLIRHVVDYGDSAAAGAGKCIGYHIVTNGTLLDRGIGDFIAARGIGLEVSIDGPRAIHDRSRPFSDGSGSYGTILRNLLAFRRRHPEHPIRIFSVITDPHAFPPLQRLLKRLGAEGFTFNRATPPAGMEKGWPDYAAVAGEAMRNRIFRHRRLLLSKGTDPDAGITRQMEAFLKGTEGRGCDAGADAVIVTRTGEIYPCPFFAGDPAHVIGDLQTGFYPEKVRPYLDLAVERSAPCRACTLRGYCSGGCAYRACRENGTVTQPCAESCRETRANAAELEKSIIALAAKRPELLCRTLSLGSDDSTLHIPPQDSGYKSFVIRLTDSCNLACSYCYDTRRPEDGRMDRETARTVVDYIMMSPVREPVVSLFGGEPLLNWEEGRFIIEEIAARSPAAGKRPFFHITTNGTLITGEMAAFFARHDMTVQISIDGARKAHDANRRFPGGTGSHAAIAAGIRLLRRANPRARIDTQVVLTPGNTDQVGIARYLRKKGFRRINFLRRAWGERFGGAWPESAILELGQAREKFFPFFMEAAVLGHPEIDLGFAALVAAEPHGTAGICECGSSEVYIDTRGDIYPCPQIYVPGEYRLGNCAVSEPAEAASVTMALDRIEEDCLRCWAFSRCRGGCAALCQRCRLVPSPLPAGSRQLWCDLMRGEFARAIIAHRILARSHPGSLAALQSIFGGNGHA